MFLATGRARSGPWVEECLAPHSLEAPGVFTQGLTSFDERNRRVHGPTLTLSLSLSLGRGLSQALSLSLSPSLHAALSRTPAPTRRVHEDKLDASVVEAVLPLTLSE